MASLAGASDETLAVLPESAASPTAADPVTQQASPVSWGKLRAAAAIYRTSDRIVSGEFVPLEKRKQAAAASDRIVAASPDPNSIGSYVATINAVLNIHNLSQKI